MFGSLFIRSQCSLQVGHSTGAIHLFQVFIGMETSHHIFILANLSLRMPLQWSHTKGVVTKTATSSKYIHSFIHASCVYQHQMASLEHTSRPSPTASTKLIIMRQLIILSRSCPTEHINGRQRSWRDTDRSSMKRAHWNKDCRKM